jgi:hypothetical protein
MIVKSHHFLFLFAFLLTGCASKNDVIKSSSNIYFKERGFLRANSELNETAQHFRLTLFEKNTTEVSCEGNYQMTSRIAGT